MSLRCKTTTRFFYKQRFFSTQPQCCSSFSWIELQILLTCCLVYNHHHTEKRFIFNLFSSLDLVLFMSHLCDLIIFIMINNIISLSHEYTGTCSFAYFSNKPYYFWMRMLMKNVNHFQIAKAWTYFKPCSRVSIVNFGQLKAPNIVIKCFCNSIL